MSASAPATSANIRSHHTPGLPPTGLYLALVLLPYAAPNTPGPKPWFYALHVPNQGYGIFSSWDSCAMHGALGGPSAAHKKFRSLEDVK